MLLVAGPRYGICASFQMICDIKSELGIRFFGNSHKYLENLFDFSPRTTMLYTTVVACGAPGRQIYGKSCSPSSTLYEHWSFAVFTANLRLRNTFAHCWVRSICDELFVVGSAQALVLHGS